MVDERQQDISQQDISYGFYTRVAKTLNSGGSRYVLLTGNVHDLFWDGSEYVPLLQFLVNKTRVRGTIQLVYELNGPIRVEQSHKQKLLNAWSSWKSGVDIDALTLRTIRRDVRHRGPSPAQKLKQEFDQYWSKTHSNISVAFELMRQLCMCSREHLEENLLIFIEGADIMVPAGKGADVSGLSDAHWRRIVILQDWVTDSEFVEGGDSVVMLADSPSLVHPRVAAHVSKIEVPAPSRDNREHFLTHQIERADDQETARTCVNACGGDPASLTAGLTLQALRKLYRYSIYDDGTMDLVDVVGAVEDYIKTECGDDVVEFKKPEHRLADVIGNRNLKGFIANELLPRVASREHSLSGLAVAGPIGCGKTFIFEAVAAELNMPVLVLKNLRSQWFGQTDVIFEKLRRVLESLERVCIFVDEADTQFGRVDGNSHETERRLTGKIQAMMSDPRLKGKVLWLLMTARIERLSPDIRRPGRAGDLIVPVLDPIDDDRIDFIKWACNAPTEDAIVKIDNVIPEMYSAADFAALRSHIAFKGSMTPATSVLDITLGAIKELSSAAIADTRKRQTAQALLNCTRRYLIPQYVPGVDRRIPESPSSQSNIDFQTLIDDDKRRQHWAKIAEDRL